MNTNTFKSILFVSLIYNCFSNQYANGEVKKNSTESQQEQILTRNLSAQDAYYKQNPWDFVENNLMIKHGKTEIILEDAAIFTISFLAAWFATMVINVFFEGIPGFEFKYSRFFSVLVYSIAITSGLTAGTFSTAVFHKYMTSYLMRYESLISILKNYDPDLNNSNPKNTKLYIPKELYPTFDALWNVYKQQGEKALKEEWCKIAQLITNKLKYEIKPSRYARPETNTYVTVVR